jgi:hypothetical protein
VLDELLLVGGGDGGHETIDVDHVFTPPGSTGAGASSV